VIGTVVSEGLRLGKRFTTDDHPSDSFAEAVLALMAKAKEGGLVSVGGEVVLIEPLSPPQSLIIFGAGHDAIPLAQMAKLVGWHVTVVDGRSAYAVAGRFPEVDHVVQAFAHDIPAKLPIPAGAAAVVMTHNYLHDLQLLKTLLPSPATYVGLLGPRRRADKLLSELGCSPVASQLAKLHAPIGLDLAAEGPDEIALAIVAEIQAFLKRRDPGFLRDSAKPLHDGENAVVLDSSAEVPICRFLA
jgi:xanthine/CO dehydrogenase XdhC/CoxF family maturation factor